MKAAVVDLVTVVVLCFTKYQICDLNLASFDECIHVE